MHLTQNELFEAIGLAVEKIEAAGASPELTTAVVILAEIRSAIGNRWNQPDPQAAKRVREKIKVPLPVEEARDAIARVVKYAQAPKNRVPIEVVASALKVSMILDAGC